MKRREFMTLLGGAAALPIVARAQAATLPSIGFLGPTASEIWSSWTKAFVDRFAELGWVDGRTIKIVYRWPMARSIAPASWPLNLSRSKSI